MSRSFFDSNVLVYSVTQADARRTAASDLLRGGGVISVQCLNEFANVARRRLGMSWSAVIDARDQMLILFDNVLPITMALHEHGLTIADRYRLSVYDSLLVAAALQAGCTTLWSEDMHDGLKIDGRLTIRNPFA